MRKIYEWIDSLWQWIAERIFVRFEFDLSPERVKVNEDTRLVFALHKVGVIEFLILSSWCRKNGLGAIAIANRKRILFLANPRFFFQILFGRRTYADLFLDKHPGPRLLSCPSSERKKLFEPVPVEKLLGEIYAARTANPKLPELRFVPVLILWRKHVRGTARKPSEFLLGMGSSPNLIGKAWYLARARRDSVVRGLEDFPLFVAPEGTDTLGEPEAMRLAKTTRRKILVQIHQEMRVILGPRYASPHAVKETLLKDPDIQKVIDQLVAGGQDRKRVMSQAYQNLTEIVARYNYRTIEIFYVVLTWIFNKVFDGVNASEEELAEVREWMKVKPVVFVSCHRSHLDYLVIPYLLFQHDMVTPHIVAGINLAFWPIGSLLRGGGAFFIRRSFRGDPLYTICIRKYVEYLLKNRYNMKFFIEGTRSRSGKMLAPAYGILKIVLEAQRNNALDDVVLIPVSICYDEVPEQGTYSKELGGGQKVKESAKELLKSTDIIKRNIGKVYVRLGKGVTVRDLWKHSEDQQQDATRTLQKTAFQLCKSINDISPITAKAIVSSVFLGSRTSSLSLEEILRMASLFVRYAEHAKYPLSTSPISSFKRNAEQTVKRLQKSNVLTLSDTQIPRVYSLDRKKRPLLNFYKNNGLHCFVRPAILLLSFLKVAQNFQANDSGVAMRSKLYDEALELRNLLKFEFFFSPTVAFLRELDLDIDHYARKGQWEHLTVGDVVAALSEFFRSWEDAGLFMRLVGDILESYLSFATFAREMPEKEKGVDKKSLIQKVAKFAEAQNGQGKLFFPESISIQNYSNALLFLENLKLVKVESQGEKKTVFVTGSEAEFRKLEDQISAYLNLMQVNIDAELRQRGLLTVPKTASHLPASSPFSSTSPG